jgi:hypothetical protein
MTTKKIRLPDLNRPALTLRNMKAPVVFVKSNEETALRDRINALECALEVERARSAETAHRWERVRKNTIRVVDRRAEWAAKMGLKQQQPLVALTSRRIVTADAWEIPHDEE